MARISRYLVACAAMFLLPAAAFHESPWPTFDTSQEEQGMTPLYRDGKVLMEEGQPYKGIIFNRPDLLAGPASLGPVPRQRSYVDMRSWQAGYLMQCVASGAKIVRVAAYQSLFGPNGTDFRALDLLLREALALDMRIALVLESHDGLDSQPEGESKSIDWYHSGYRSPYGGYRHSLLGHVGHLTRRYAGHPAIAWWEILDQVDLPGHPELVGAMVTDVAHALKTMDSAHLVAAGTGSWATTHISHNVDLVAVSDPAGTSWENFPLLPMAAQRAAESLGKPMVVVSSALSLHNFSAEARALEYHRRLVWAAENDIQVFGLFHYDALPAHRDAYSIEAGDPAVGAVRTVSVREFAMPDGRPTPAEQGPDGRARRARARQPWWHFFRQGR